MRTLGHLLKTVCDGAWATAAFMNLQGHEEPRELTKFTEEGVLRLGVP